MGLVSAGQALQRLREILQDELHVFWPDDLRPTSPDFDIASIHGPGQLTDRYLLALATAHGGTLATFDRAMAAALPPDSPLIAHLEIIPG